MISYYKFAMKVFGLDFTSSPSPKKPLVCAHGYGRSKSELMVSKLERFTNFEEFEEFLSRSGPWIAGFDFPFGLPVTYLRDNNFPLEWNDYVGSVAKFTKKELEQKVLDYKSSQPKGLKDLPRITDSIHQAQSPLKTVNPPLIKMFYEGATRLAKSGISVIPFNHPKDNRVAFETYPALLSRLFADSYKSDSSTQNKEQFQAGRTSILNGILSDYLLKNLGFSLEIDEDVKKQLLEDNSGDSLDSVLCCIQAYWSFLQGWPHFGINSKNHFTIKSEGWIVSPHLPPPEIIPDGSDGLRKNSLKTELSETHDALDNLRNELKRFSDIGRALSRESNIEILLEMIIDRARDLTKSDGGTLYILENKTLTFKIVQNESLNIRMGGSSNVKITFPPVELNKSNVSAYVALTGELVNIPDVYNFKPFDFTGPRKFDKQTGYRTKSMLVVPMKNHQNEVVGVLQLINAKRAKLAKEVTPFLPEYVSLVESLASQAAVAITNVQLISEAQKMASMLRESEARTKAIMDDAPDGILVLDELETIISFNRAAEKIFGYHPSEVEGDKFNKLFPENYTLSSQTALKQFLDSTSGSEAGLLSEAIGQRKNGAVFPLDVSVSEVTVGKSKLFSVILRDISKQKKVEKEKLLYSRAFESTADAVVITDSKGIIQSVNPAFTTITGFNSSEVMGQTNQILKSGSHPPEFYKEMWDVINEGKVWIGNLENKKKDGSNYFAALTISPILNIKGENEGFIGVHRDVTAEKEAEKKTQEANRHLAHARDEALEASKVKSRFLANMSHELRTPMNAIIGYSEILLEELEDLDEQELVGDVKKIHGAGKQLLGLIQDILDLSKIEAGKMEVHLETFTVSDLLKEVEDIIQPLASKNKNELKITVTKDPGSMFADSGRIRQTLLNLLSNACKFTENGVIDLIVNRTKRDLDTMDWLSFQVKDTGMGMDGEQLKKLFDEFTQAHSTRKFGGTGLGLAISRRFCRMMGGDISVKSVLGVGSTFTIRLPEKVASQEEKTRRRAQDDSKKGN